MGEKSEQKRLYILEKAAGVFAAKGFRAVSMKDIVDACEISRGGLYLYYSGTEEIFRDVLKLRLEAEDEASVSGVGADTAMADLLLLFLKEQKKEILRKKNSLTVAAYEYYFAHPTGRGAGQREENMLKQQFDTALKVLRKILEEGVARGEFYCEDCRSTATSMMYALEGMKICARTFGLTEARLDKELLYLLEGIVLEDA
ncbi:MAG: TetR family transcriptional regulator [Lachnospiraceae bacterium]|nr:TetR family transcriptional regulator [Lachnospiraceae bacterium]